MEVTTSTVEKVVLTAKDLNSMIELAYNDNPNIDKTALAPYQEAIKKLLRALRYDSTNPAKPEFVPAKRSVLGSLSDVFMRMATKEEVDISFKEYLSGEEARRTENAFRRTMSKYE